MDEIGLDQVGFASLSKLVTCTEANPSSTADTSHAHLILVNAIFGGVLTNMSHSRDHIALAFWRLSFWTFSIVYIENNAFQVESCVSHEVILYIS